MLKILFKRNWNNCSIVSYHLILSLVHWLTHWLIHLCVINFLCLTNLLARFWNVFLHWNWNYVWLLVLFSSFLGAILNFEFEEPCLAIAWDIFFIIYLIVLFHLLVSFILLSEHVLLINTPHFSIFQIPLMSFSNFSLALHRKVPY